MLYRLLIIVLILFSQGIAAGQINRSSVDYDAGIYRLSFDVEIDADFETVRAIVTDYADLARLSDLLIESEVIATPKEQPQRRLLVARACILFFCRKVKLAESIETIGRDRFITTTIPELSDFKSGTIQWQLIKMADHRTRLKLHGWEEPDFWIPPIIGPLLIKHRLVREAQVIINNIENITANG